MASSSFSKRMCADRRTTSACLTVSMLAAPRSRYRGLRALHRNPFFARAVPCTRLHRAQRSSFFVASRLEKNMIYNNHIIQVNVYDKCAASRHGVFLVFPIYFGGRATRSQMTEICLSLHVYVLKLVHMVSLYDKVLTMHQCTQIDLER